MKWKKTLTHRYKAQRDKERGIKREREKEGEKREREREGEKVREKREGEKRERERERERDVTILLLSRLIGP